MGMISGCFDPRFPAELTCDDGRCPPGYQCGGDNVCREGGGGGPGIDGGDEPSIADAGTPDAAPVPCNGDEDCANPEDPCLVADCQDDMCRFVAVDCSDLDSACTVGVCESGECAAMPARENMDCGESTVTDCNPAICEFSSVCDEIGPDQDCTCTDLVCQRGECTPLTTSCAQPCTRDTEGLECGDPSRDACCFSGNCSPICPF